MKKTISIIILFTLIFTFAACGKKDVQNTTVASTTANNTETRNEVVKADAEQINSIAETTLNVPSDSLFNYVTKDGNEYGQVSFKSNDADFVLKVEKSDSLSNRSGYYFDWTVDEKCKVLKYDAQALIFDDIDNPCSVLIWYNSDTNVLYSLITDSILTVDELVAVAESV